MPQTLNRFIGFIAFAACTALHAQEAWPSKAIRIVVGTAPGGSPDTLARMLAPVLSEKLGGQPVIVESKPGSQGIISLQYMQSNPPDGYTWLLGTPAHMIVAPLMTGSARVDTVQGFQPLSLVARATNVLVVGSHLKADSVAQLAELARKSANNLNYGSPGLGSPAHLGGAMFGSLAGVQVTHVPYKGAGQALGDLAGGQIDFMFTSLLISTEF